MPMFPEMIRYYLGEEPLLSNVPDLFVLASLQDMAYVLDHLEALVVKCA